jgi:aromatic ring-opening dioxygenase catalytic subunit (LigB family)
MVITVNHTDFARSKGPLPVLDDPNHKDIVRSFKTRVPKILKLGTPDAPRAIVLVTAHWSTADPNISAGSAPKLYYDYGGFPGKAYELKYPAAGSPGVAQQVKKAMESEGLKPVLDEKRGMST